MKLSLVRRKLERSDREIQKAVDAGEIASAVVLATQEVGDETLSYEGVFGCASLSPHREDARMDHRYDLASLTKVMATTPSILLLCAEGRLRLDQRVADVLPLFAERGKDEITVRQLLTHSSGLRPWRGYFEDLRERELRRGERLLATPAGRESIVNRILRSAPVYEAGAASVYGDLDFIVLGELVAEVADESLDRFCARRIYEPLGMRDTGFNTVPFEGDASRYAATEQCAWREKVLRGEVHDPNAWAMGGVAGHAGLFATASDVLRFAHEMLAADAGKSELFGRELAREFFQRQELKPADTAEPPPAAASGGLAAGGSADSAWALGWDTPTPGRSTSGERFSPRSIGHTGFTGTSVWIDLAARVSIVLLCNRVHLVAKRSRFALRPLVHDRIREAFDAA